MPASGDEATNEPLTVFVQQKDRIEDGKSADNGANDEKSVGKPPELLTRRSKTVTMLASVSLFHSLYPYYHTRDESALVAIGAERGHRNNAAITGTPL